MLLPTSKSPCLIAFYLPQFHPIPENDEWWGRGFTEWTNVAKAKPLFPGHYQPHVPADLGFYDLRVPEVRIAQAELAREYGIGAFCYYHYWFAGRRLLNRPFDEVLKSDEPDFPFCLCWANQTWTGIWHGAPDRVLIEQTYPGEEDYRAHFAALLPAFRDKRYLRLDGKPVFVLYVPEDIPDLKEMVSLWRELAREAGFPGLFLIANIWVANNRANLREPDYYAWQSQFDGVTGCSLTPSWHSWRRPIRKIRRKIRLWVERKIGLPVVYSYRGILPTLLPESLPTDKAFPTVIPNWDNSPRSGARGLVIHGSTPELFGLHLRQAIDLVDRFSPDKKIIFVKSWNEWGEGNHLEPDLRYGRQYLEVVADELSRSISR